MKAYTLKVFLFGFITFLTALAVSFFFRALILSPAAGALWTFFAAAILFLSLFLLQGFFVKGRGALAGIAALDAVALGGAFAAFLSQSFLVGIFIAWILFAVGLLLAGAALEKTITVRFFTVAKQILRHTTRGFLCFLVIGFLAIILAGSGDTARGIITSGVTAIPGITPETTVHDLISRFIPADTVPQDRAAIAAQAAQQLNEYSRKFTGVPIHANDTIPAAIERLTISKINSLTGYPKAIALAAIVLFLYLSVRFIFFFIDVAVLALSYGIYKTLGAFSFYRLDGMPSDQEVITLLPPEIIEHV